MRCYVCSRLREFVDSILSLLNDPPLSPLEKTIIGAFILFGLIAGYIYGKLIYG